MTHGPHSGILEHGLADHCERCDEIAANPFVGLDNNNLRELAVRAFAGEPARSGNEQTAMSAVRSAALAVKVLRNLGVEVPS